MATTTLYRTPGGAGNEKTWTFSSWIKRGELGTHQSIFSQGVSGDYMSCRWNSSDFLTLGHWNGSSWDIDMESQRRFRDPGAWYHIVITMDPTESVAADRAKIYINGVQDTEITLGTYPSLNLDTNMNSTTQFNLGYNAATSQYYFDGVMAHTILVDGTAYAASSFGETDATSGIWVPISAPSVTYGTNGFFLKYASGALGTDSSGNGNTMTVGGTMTNTKDTPDNNFCTLNPLDNYYPASTFSTGNNTVVTGAGIYAPNTGTMAMVSGKWYFELEAVARTSGNEYVPGIVSVQTVDTTHEVGTHANDYGYRSYNGDIMTGGSASSYGNVFDTGDIVGVAVDLTNSKLYFSINGTWQNSGVPTSGATGTGAVSITAVGSTVNNMYLPVVSYYGGGGSTGTLSTNFGNGYFGTTSHGETNADDAGIGLFKYDVPAGYYALCTNNLGDQS